MTLFKMFKSRQNEPQQANGKIAVPSPQAMTHAVKSSGRDQFKAAYALNMCMVSLSQIVDYKDLEILKMEYDTILNNLNLETVIKDESLLQALKAIMDACHFYILHARDKELLKKKQAMRMKGALAQAFGGGNVVAIFGSMNPWAIAAGAAVMLGVAAVNYKSQRAKARMENELEEWELDKSALEQLHNLRRTLFETAWRLEERYNYPDEYRLTEKQIAIYNEAVSDPDPQNRYERLWLMRDSFKAYPLFWYYLGRAALETADAYLPESGTDGRMRLLAYGCSDWQMSNYYREKAKTALDMFREKHFGNGLMREDVIAASAYLDHAQLCGENELDVIRDDVDLAMKFARNDTTVVQSCAFRYLQLMESFRKVEATDAAKHCRSAAIECLKIVLDRDFNPEVNGRILSKLYIEQGDSNAFFEYNILKNCMARKCPFVYQRIFPWNQEMLEQDWKHYLDTDANGLTQTAFNYFYGLTWLAYRDFFVALETARRTQDMMPLYQLKEAGWGEAEEDENAVIKIFGYVATAQFPADALVMHLLSARREQKVREADKSLLGRMRMLIELSSERAAAKLWLGTHVAGFSSDKFGEAEKDVMETMVNEAKIKAFAYAEEFRSKYASASGFDFEALKENADEPESMKEVGGFEKKAEEFRLQIQDCLGLEKPFRYPDPCFPTKPLCDLSRDVYEKLNRLHEYGREVRRKMVESYRAMRKANVSLETVQKLNEKGIK